MQAVPHSLKFDSVNCFLPVSRRSRHFLGLSGDLKGIQGNGIDRTSSISYRPRFFHAQYRKESTYITNFITFLPLGTCTFAADNCGFIQDTNDQFDWTRAASYTRSQDTGPSVDHTYGTSANGML